MGRAMLPRGRCEAVERAKRTDASRRDGRMVRRIDGGAAMMRPIGDRREEGDNGVPHPSRNGGGAARKGVEKVLGRAAIGRRWREHAGKPG